MASQVDTYADQSWASRGFYSHQYSGECGCLVCADIRAAKRYPSRMTTLEGKARDAAARLRGLGASAPPSVSKRQATTCQGRICQGSREGTSKEVVPPMPERDAPRSVSVPSLRLVPHRA